MTTVRSGFISINFNAHVRGVRESSILRRRAVIAAALGRTGIDVTDMRAAIAARERILRSVESKGLRPRSKKK